MTNQTMADEATDDTTSETGSAGQASEWEVGTMKMRRVGGRPLAVVRTASGFHAIDNACPHQGYGLTTGALDGEHITCQWHNWKFDVTTGRCLRGEEDVACHGVEVVDGEVLVTVDRPSPEEERARLWPSLRRGLEADYVGQVARDSTRLLTAGAEPAEIMWAGVALAAPRTEDGIGHELAMAADCLALAEVRTGTDRALPLVQGLSGLAEVTRDRPRRPLPAPDPSVDVPAVIEAEDAEAAMAGVLGAVLDGAEPSAVRDRLIEAASAHHLGYGHGMIYTQKSFEFLDRVGWDHAAALLPHLASRIVWSTREDTLPYMAKAMRQLATVDLGRLADSEQRVDGWRPEALVDELLAAPEAPIARVADEATRGAGIEGLLDAVSLGAARRLLRHDLTLERDLDEPFGWLDITHVLTTAQAARWAWRAHPGPHTARAALFAVWLLFDSGRSERRNGVVAPPQPDGSITDLAEAVTVGDEAAAAALAAEGDPAEVGDVLAQASLLDRAGSFIVAAHLIKTTEAARRETAETGSPLALAAAARFLAAPRAERFVAANVAEAVDFVTTGRPPRR
jgi:nitrite reductase/ring-hydroxylating ferredoxin subunit